MTRRRLDVELVSRRLATSRELARSLILDGRVTVGGAPALKPSRLVSPAEAVVVHGPPPRYVSRAGAKLESALDGFGVAVSGQHALDVGASTGGFTDCLLQHGAASVRAIDVGRSQLHERLRSDARVVSWERTDIRNVGPESFEDDPWLAAGFGVVVVDLSFISTAALLPRLATLLARDGDLIVLVKPQFEAGRDAVSRGRGVIADPTVWRDVLHLFIDAAFDTGLEVVDLAISPVRGGKGNVEFLGHLRFAGHTEAHAPNIA